MRWSRAVLAALLVTGVLGGVWSTPAAAAKAKPRIVTIKVVDVAFEPASIDVTTGEKVTFVFTNRGKVDHDAFIGDTKAQAKHERAMRKAKDNEHGGHDRDGANALTVKPAARAKLTYTFEKAGTVEIGCHEPGHYDAGMKVAVTVAVPAAGPQQQ